MIKSFKTFLIILTFFSCKSEKKEELIESNEVIVKEEELNRKESLKDAIEFKKLGKESGFYFVNELLETEESNILNYEYLYNGSGVAIGDINNDGLPDVFMGGNFFGGRLFLNKGNLQFEQISESAGVFFEGFTTGVCFVDINNDGFDDIYLSRSKSKNPEERRNILLINNKDLTFTNKAKDYGVNDPGYSTNSIFFDYDNDGDLDLYVLNHRSDFKNATVIPINGQALPYEKSDQEYSSDRLYENVSGKFIDITKRAGLFNNRFGLGVFASDINDDGWLDLYISNDFNDKDHLYINNKGKFIDKIDDYLGHLTKNSMGCEIADINNDCLEDIVTLDMTPEDSYRQKQLSNSTTYDMYQLGVEKGLGHQILRNCLHIKDNKSFAEIGQLMGVSHTDWSWSPIIADFDNDGKKDLFISNGYYRDVTDLDYVKHGTSSVISAEGGLSSNWQMKVIEKANSIPLMNYLYKNVGNKFNNVSEYAWGNDSTFSNGCVYADLDLDGDLDLICNNFNQPSAIYENKSEKLGNNFIGFISKSSKCKVYLFSGNDKQLVDSNPYRGYMSSHHKIAHFGLGNASIVDSIIYTINNVTKVIYNPLINKYYNLDEVEGIEASVPNFSKRHDLTIKEINSLMNKDDKRNVYNDFKYEPLLTRKKSSFKSKKCKGDINNDGLIDLFIPGEAGVSGKVLLQDQEGKFNVKQSELFHCDKEYHDASATLVDFDSDGDLDLFVASGGYQFEIKSNNYGDRIYINDGSGNFEKKKFVGNNSNSTSSITFDFNNDGKDDVFVLGGAQPLSYPVSDKSYCLVNNGNSLVETYNLFPFNGDLGIVNDVKIFKEGDREILILAREWDSPLALEYKNEKFEDVSEEFKFNRYSGIWNSILVTDIDNDGKDDLVLGNIGENDFYKVGITNKATLVYGDLFDSGEIDAIEFYKFNDGEYHCKHSLDELFKINPIFRKTYPRYHLYSKSNMNDFLKNFNSDSYRTKHINTKQTLILLNKKEGFIPVDIPIQAQYSEVNESLYKDLNNDGVKDLILIGNNKDLNVKQGVKDAGGIQVLYGNKSIESHFDKDNYLRLSSEQFISVIEVNNRVIFMDANYKLWELEGF